jgi:type VI secretion system protein ImpA
MFDLNKLLQPVSGPTGCGEDLSFSRELDAIAEARRFDDSSLDQGEWVTDVKTADWPYVVRNCAGLIESRSKDLRLAVWLAEANAKVHHFSGLAEGYSVLGGLLERFWDGMYPLPEDGDQEQRIGNLSWILSRSVHLVREIPLTEGKGSAFSLLDFETARARALNAEKQGSESITAEEGPKLADMEAARKRSSRAFYQKLLDDAQRCHTALLQLEAATDSRLGVDGPGFAAAKEAMENAVQVVTRYAHDAGLQTSAPANAAQPQQEASTPIQVAPAVNAGIQFDAVIHSRTQALSQLRAVADFFRRTEPHSPVAYLADKAAHWGEMPLHTWLSTVIKDSASLSHVEELLGVKAPDTQ